MHGETGKKYHARNGTALHSSTLSTEGSPSRRWCAAAVGVPGLLLQNRGGPSACHQLVLGTRATYAPIVHGQDYGGLSDPAGAFPSGPGSSPGIKQLAFDMPHQFTPSHPKFFTRNVS